MLHLAGSPYDKIKVNVVLTNLMVTRPFFEIPSLPQISIHDIPTRSRKHRSVWITKKELLFFAPPRHGHRPSLGSSKKRHDRYNPIESIAKGVPRAITGSLTALLVHDLLSFSGHGKKRGLGQPNGGRGNVSPGTFMVISAIREFCLALSLADRILRVWSVS